MGFFQDLKQDLSQTVNDFGIKSEPDELNVEEENTTTASEDLFGSVSDADFEDLESMLEKEVAALEKTQGGTQTLSEEPDGIGITSDIDLEALLSDIETSEKDGAMAEIENEIQSVTDDLDSSKESEQKAEPESVLDGLSFDDIKPIEDAPVEQELPIEEPSVEEEQELPSIEELAVEEGQELPSIEELTVEEEQELPSIEELAVEEELPSIEELAVEEEQELPSIEELSAEEEQELPSIEALSAEEELELPPIEELVVEEELPPIEETLIEEIPTEEASKEEIPAEEELQPIEEILIPEEEPESDNSIDMELSAIENKNSEADEEMEQLLNEVEQNIQEHTYMDETSVKAQEDDSEINAAVSTDTAVITAGMNITGDVTSSGNMDLIGNITGNIEILGKLNVTGSITGNSAAAEVYAESAQINGEINSKGSVKIGQSSVVIGNIFAKSAVIAGAVKGDIDVHGPVILDTSAIVMGNIKSKSVQINNGAVIEGMCSQCYADISPTSFFDDVKKNHK